MAAVKKVTTRIGPEPTQDEARCSGSKRARDERASGAKRARQDAHLYRYPAPRPRALSLDLDRFHAIDSGPDPWTSCSCVLAELPTLLALRADFGFSIFSTFHPQAASSRKVPFCACLYAKLVGAALLVDRAFPVLR